jgi:hypothetical protein
MSTSNSTTNVDDIWIGGIGDVNGDNIYTWRDGNQWSYENWAPSYFYFLIIYMNAIICLDYPSTTDPSNNRCVAMNIQGVLAETWQNADCNQHKAFVCEVMPSI